MTNEEIQEIFFVECDEALIAAELGLAACKDGTHDPDTINAVFRSIHSIKGGAGAFGYMPLQAYTHIIETLLAGLREGSVALGDTLIDLLLRSLDTLSDHVTAARTGAAPPADADSIAALTAAQSGSTSRTSSAGDLDLDALLDAIVGEIGGAASGAVPIRWPLQLRPHAAAMRNGGEPLLLLRELVGLGGDCIVCDTSAIPSLELFDPEQGYLSWSMTMPASVSQATVQDLFDFVSEDYALSMGDHTALAPALFNPAQAAIAAQEAIPKSAPVASHPPTAPPAPPQAQSIRIDLAKLDRLIDLVGELVIAQAMTAQRLTSDGLAETEELTLLEGLVRDIQESAMSIRTQPIDTAFSRVPRILRELTDKSGKQVVLELSGAGTEIDKTVIDMLGEPFTHLIRNAVDHGIETPTERIAAGKPAHGTLKLSAEQRSGRIIVRIADDGRGIDRERVFAKAVEQGLVQLDARLSNEEIDELIFAPGFSTAASVTSVSGRGVGMDVVRQNVKQLGGRITIASEVGQGTCFTLTLPLTLAIADGMIVAVGDQLLVVPLPHIVECLRPPTGAIQALGAGNWMLNMRGRFIPVLPLSRLTGTASSPPLPDTGVLVIVETELAGQAALLVDAICDQRQFVVKSLNTHFHAVAGVAGATILGDGKVALILDVDWLVASATAQPEKQAA